MPQLTIRGIEAKKVAEASPILSEKLSNIMACSKDDLTFDLIETKSFQNGLLCSTYPFITILWFERGDAVRDASAAMITEVFKKLGISEMEIVFVTSEPTHYYGNGVSYAKE